MLSISNLWPLFLKIQDFNILEKFGISIFNQKQDFSKIENSDYFISWGESVFNIRHSLLEYGFFKDAAHIDRHGLYDRASFNFPFAREVIENYDALKKFSEFKREDKIQSKFSQPINNCQWNGVVIACQYPKDRSIISIGSTKDYYNFLEDACKFYGKKVFLKKHPVMVGNKQENEIINLLCSKYKCEQGYIGASVLEKAEAVLVYNSTYVIDAIQGDIPVMQYAPGYFWQAGIVDYLSGSFTHKPKNPDPIYIGKFLDFLIWKYCFHLKMPMESISNMLRVFETSKKLFPLPEEFSYGSFILNS